LDALSAIIPFLGSISIPIVWLIISIIIAVWVYEDAKERGENAALWLLIVILTGFLGLIVWLVVRPSK
jgi:TctA family transporter